MPVLIAIFRNFLTLRYSVTIKGAELLKKPGAKLVLPNHQALVDPLIVFTFIRKYTRIVPVVLESYFKIPLIGAILRRFGSVPVTDISTQNRNVTVLHTISENAGKALESGQPVLIYPSGQIAGQGYELLFNKQGAHNLVRNIPENAAIIALRTNGLWGSIWSRAWHGFTPSFVTVLLKSIFYVFANLFFFTPRRKVSLEFIDITAEAVKKAAEGRQPFNRYLESVYNVHGIEKPLFLKHFFYAPTLKRKLPEKIAGSFDDVQINESAGKNEISREILTDIINIVAKETGAEVHNIKLNSNINLDLNIDSVSLVTILTEIEEKYSLVTQTEITQIRTIEDLCVIASGKKQGVEILKPSELTIHNIPHTIIKVDKTKTITEQFISKFSSNGNEPFAYDKIMGCLSRKDFLLKAYVVSVIIRKNVKGKKVGIMLPALQSTTLLVMSTYIAGKIPVMLNWTTGSKIMEHCISQSGISVILTAKSFHDKISDLLSPAIKEKCMFFEEKVKQLTLSTKLRGLLKFIFKIRPAVRLSDTAVVLFTSGSESLPKQVELSHKNIVSDLWGVFQNITISTDKIFLAFLPPFHSFGFTVLTILPAITGLKTAYSPDPTDSRELLKILKHTKANTLLATPTFLKMLCSVAVSGELRKVELAISGAESLNPAILKSFLEKAGSPDKAITAAGEKAVILEGYGITECAPVLSLNPLEKQKINSVGQFIKGVEPLIVDVTGFTSLPQGKEGLILVRGDNVFNGYTDTSIPTPFVKVDGKEYYNTGDLGYIDSEGFLFLTGRLKRFIKIAGEMVSLPAIERTLLEKYGQEDKTVLALEGTDQVQPPVIALFACIPLNLNEVNAYLKEKGYSGIIKVSKIIDIEDIPLLGTGKTDYKVLKGML